jgi:hypothetical protein
MHLRRLYIKGFRSIRELDLEFTPGKNVIFIRMPGALSVTGLTISSIPIAIRSLLLPTGWSFFEPQTKLLISF